MDIFDLFMPKDRKALKAVVFPEGEESTIIRAAAQLRRESLVTPLLLGNPERVGTSGRSLSEDLGGIEVIDPAEDPRLADYAARYSRNRSMPGSACRRILSQPLYFGAMMVRQGDAHGMVAGIAHPTEEVIMAAELIVGLKPGISLPSSFYLMEIPGYAGSEGNLLVFADPAVNPDPGPEQLADIAVTTAMSVRELMGWEPRVALLSFSTRGSASHPNVDKVARAVDRARQKAPGLLFDGEIQADAALVESVARRKMGDAGAVAGRANVLVFPNLDAANISAKLVQALAEAKAYGPVLQGFDRPVSDLSRSATVRDVVGAALLVAARG